MQTPTGENNDIMIINSLLKTKQKIATRDNPIVKIGDRDENEFKMLLEKMGIPEKENNEYRNKYEIYLGPSAYINIIEKNIQGYIWDYYIYDYCDKIGNTQKKYIEFLFVDIYSNFYILAFDCEEKYICGKIFYYFGNYHNYDNNTKIYNLSEMNFENKKNGLFKQFSIEGVNDISTIFHSPNYFSENNKVNLEITEKLKGFVSEKLNIWNCRHYFLYKYSGYILNRLNNINLLRENILELEENFQ